MKKTIGLSKLISLVLVYCAFSCFAVNAWGFNDADIQELLSNANRIQSDYRLEQKEFETTFENLLEKRRNNLIKDKKGFSTLTSKIRNDIQAVTKILKKSVANLSHYSDNDDHTNKIKTFLNDVTHAREIIKIHTADIQAFIEEDSQELPPNANHVQSDSRPEQNDKEVKFLKDMTPFEKNLKTDVEDLRAFIEEESPSDTTDTYLEPLIKNKLKDKLIPDTIGFFNSAIEYFGEIETDTPQSNTIYTYGDFKTDARYIVNFSLKEMANMLKEMQNDSSVPNYDTDTELLIKKLENDIQAMQGDFDIKWTKCRSFHCPDDYVAPTNKDFISFLARAKKIIDEDKKAIKSFNEKYHQQNQEKQEL